MRRCRKSSACAISASTLLSDQIKVTSQFLEVSERPHAQAEKTTACVQALQRRSAGPPMPDQIAEDLVRMATTSARKSRICARSSSEESTMRKLNSKATSPLQRAEGHPLTPKTRILLGVTGGIAAYKSPDLVRG
jgi:hypothetical protein